MEKDRRGGGTEDVEHIDFPQYSERKSIIIIGTHKRQIDVKIRHNDREKRRTSIDTLIKKTHTHTHTSTVIDR